MTPAGESGSSGSAATGPRHGITAEERAVLDLVTVDEVVELTRRLVRCPGENPPGQEAATVAELAAICAEHGLEVREDEVAPGRANVTARLPGADGPGLLLLGHTDVVPVGDEWTRDPFGGDLVDGRVYGRGATDMKGGLAACVVAMSALRRAGVPLSGPVELLAAVDEEETGLGIRAWIGEHARRGADADPDAGGAAPAYAGCIVAEPTELQTIIAARGDSYLEITVTGVAAHSGNPDDGRNAVTGAALVVAEIDRWHREFAQGPRELGGLVGVPTFNAGLIAGGQGISTVPASCRIGLDRRLMPGEDPDRVLAGVRERVDGLDLTARGLDVHVEMTMDMPGFASAPDSAFVVVTDAALADAGGPGLPLSGWTAACDGGFVARETGAPVVVLGPGSVNDQAHRPDESVGVQELLVAARAYTLAALRLLT